MEHTRVLICHCESILELGLESLFAQYKNLSIAECTPKNEPELTTLVAEFQPDVVIVGECSPVAQEPILSQLLRSSPEIRVINVSADSNWLHVYHRQDVLLTDASDLIKVIQFDKGGWIDA